MVAACTHSTAVFFQSKLMIRKIVVLMILISLRAKKIVNKEAGLWNHHRRE